MSGTVVREGPLRVAFAAVDSSKVKCELACKTTRNRCVCNLTLLANELLVSENVREPFAPIFWNVSQIKI